MSFWERIIVGFFIGYLCAGDYIHARKEHDFETRVTELEQSQCVTKEHAQHADVKFSSCMKQLVKR